MESKIFQENSPELKVYWDSLGQGNFLVPHCRTCGQSHWYPRGICPHCFSVDLEPKVSAGEGVVFSHTHAPNASYSVAYVTLDEGPTLLTRIVGVPPESLFIGQRVRYIASQEPGAPGVPFFQPAG